VSLVAQGGSARGTPRAAAIEIAGIAALRGLGVLLVLALGFRAISDDDYSRVVIAERLVAEPRLDPSGTSWLPFPFHALGAAMAVAGRSLAVARVASVGLALGSGAALHGALFAWEVPRRARLVAMLAVALLPWMLWTTAATVPEACTAALTAAAVLFAALPEGRATARSRLAAGALVCLATLSRYEAWPAAIVVAALLAYGGARAPGSRGSALGGVALALAGVLGWMAWNHATHGSATHFLFRVAKFKRALGGPEAPLGERLAAYPGLLGAKFPEAVLAVAALLALVRRADSLRPARVAALATAAAVLLFLVYGALHDGVPTHHSERALLGIVLTVIPVAIASVAHRGSARAWAAAGALVVAVELGHLAASEAPGGGAADRSAQVARGHALRGATHLTVVPCAYEHFALVAAYGRPEHTTIEAPRITEGPCPRVAEEADPPSK